MTTVVLGMQWGDEGKGKIIDVLAENADVVVRFQGGNNAGHTVEIGDDRFILHLIPSGILRAETICVIGNGMVVDPIGLVEEIKGLEGKGISIRHRLQLSSRAHLVFNFHKVIDGWNETHAGGATIGTTRRGIGPAYRDKAGRIGIRAQELTNLERFEQKFEKLLTAHNRQLQINQLEILDKDREWATLVEAARVLAPLVTDTVLNLNHLVDEGKQVVFEGAQGVWLDIDHGTYPYVTSSNTTIGGVCTGAGVPPKKIDRVIGVAKAYSTRVGEGPFPTELTGNFGEQLRRIGREFGATTGRPRRCGWFDIVACRYAAMLNGIGSLAVTKLDVLSNFEHIKICTGYKIDGMVTHDMPTAVEDVSRAEPLYETCPGWQCDISGVDTWSDLPESCRRYLGRLSELLDIPIQIISVGPRRKQVFFA